MQAVDETMKDRVQRRTATRRWWQTFKKENMLNHLQLQEKNPIQIM